MSLEIVTEPVNIEQIITKEKIQVMFEHDIIVPDTKEDVNNILYVDSELLIRENEVTNDKVKLNGSIRFNILYLSDDEKKAIKSVDTTLPFSCEMDMLNARSGMSGRAVASVEHINYEVVNSRKMNIKTFVNLYVKVYDELSKEVITHIRSEENIQTLDDTVKINLYLGENRTSHLVKESMQVPESKFAIKEILSNKLKITEKECKITENCVVVEGVLNITTMFIGDDEKNSIQIVENETSFSQTLELQGINDRDISEANFEILEWNIVPREDSDGELRVLDVEVLLNIYVKGYTARELNMVLDAYTSKSRIELEKEYIRSHEIAREFKEQIVVKESFALENYDSNIIEVVNVTCKPSSHEFKNINDRIIIEGVISANALYLLEKENQTLQSICREIPFRHEIYIDSSSEDKFYELDFDILHCGYSIVSQNEIELRLTVGLITKIIKNRLYSIAREAVENPIEEEKMRNNPSITVYFTKPGDTLWKIGKEYLTNVDIIKNINNLNEILSRDEISQGLQIIIPRYA